MTFNSTDTEKTFSFAAASDSVDDDGESVKLTFGALPTGVTEGTTKESVVSITDDDVPAVTVSYGQGTYTVAEGSSVTVKVKLSVAPERTVTVPINKDPQGGATTADYSGVPTSVTFNSTDTEKTFSFAAASDSVDDDGESVKLTFGAMPTGVTEGTTKESVVSITDDDVPAVTVSYEQGTYTVAEGSSVTVKVKLSVAPERTVTVPINKAPQGGVTTADYSGVPTSVTFNSTDTEVEIPFAAASDSVDDDGESVKLTFGAMPTGVTEGTTKESVVSITDDDVPAVTVSYEQGTYTVAEGSSVTVKVKLSVAPERTVTVPINKAPQGGVTTADYSGVPTSVTFNSTDTEKTFSFAAASDSVDDDGESVKLTFGTLPTGITAGTTNESVVSITDDATMEQITSVQVSFAVYAYTVPEGSSVAVTINLSDDPERTVTIPITPMWLNGADNDDYSGVPTSVTFNNGDTQKTFTFSATQDSIQDAGEAVRLTFGDLPDGVTTGSPAETNFTITEEVAVSFSMATYVATEGGPDATVTVELSGPAPRRVDILFTAEGRGGAIPTDWSGVPEKLTFNAGDTSMAFTFVAVDDDVEDDGEMVELGFGALPSGLALGSPATTRVTLMNDDMPHSEQVQDRCPDDSGERIVLVSVGEISQPGEVDFWRIEMDPGRFYVLEVLGTNDGWDVTGEDNPGGLTLSDPHLYGVWNGDQSELIKKTGTKRRSRVIVNRADDLSGHHQIEVRSFGGNTGTYQIKVRVNNMCAMSGDKAIYSYAGGPDGYVWDTPSNNSTRDELRPHPLQNIQIQNLLGDNEGWYWESEPDEDWYGIKGVKENYEYTIDVWTMDELPAKHQATRLKILGIYDSNGMEVPNTSSAGSGKTVSVTFQPDNTEMFYVSVGSDSSDRTGAYRISISARNLQESKNQRRRSVPREEPDITRWDQPDGENSSKKRIEPEKLKSPASGIQAIIGRPKWVRDSRRARRACPSRTG